MCTLWLYASYDTATAPLLTSIFNSSPPQLVHACPQAITCQIFSSFLVFVYLYISDLKGAPGGV